MIHDKPEELMEPKSPGRVDVALSEYLNMRDTLFHLLETTKTQEEFLKQFRLSMIVILNTIGKERVDLSSLLEYYSGTKFKPIEKVSFRSFANS